MKMILVLGMVVVAVFCSVMSYTFDVATTEQGWKGYFKWLLHSIKSFVMGDGNYSPPDTD